MPPKTKPLESKKGKQPATIRQVNPQGAMNEYLKQNQLRASQQNRNNVAQTKWRNKIFDVIGGGKCEISGIGQKEVLETAHIKPQFLCTDEEKWDLNNGIILSKNFHALYDAGLISFDENGKLMFSEELNEKDKDLIFNGVDINNFTLANHEVKQKNLEYHRNNIFFLNEASQSKQKFYNKDLSKLFDKHRIAFFKNRITIKNDKKFVLDELTDINKIISTLKCYVDERKNIFEKIINSFLIISKKEKNALVWNIFEKKWDLNNDVYVLGNSEREVIENWIAEENTIMQPIMNYFFNKKFLKKNNVNDLKTQLLNNIKDNKLNDIVQKGDYNDEIYLSFIDKISDVCTLEGSFDEEIEPYENISINNIKLEKTSIEENFKEFNCYMYKKYGLKFKYYENREDYYQGLFNNVKNYSFDKDKPFFKDALTYFYQIKNWDENQELNDKQNQELSSYITTIKNYALTLFLDKALELGFKLSELLEEQMMPNPFKFNQKLYTESRKNSNIVNKPVSELPMPLKYETTDSDSSGSEIVESEEYIQGYSKKLTIPQENLTHIESVVSDSLMDLGLENQEGAVGGGRANTPPTMSQEERLKVKEIEEKNRKEKKSKKFIKRFFTSKKEDSHQPEPFSQ